MEAALFGDSDDEVSPARAPVSRAPKARPFKRPPLAPQPAAGGATPSPPTGTPTASAPPEQPPAAAAPGVEPGATAPQHEAPAPQAMPHPVAPPQPAPAFSEQAVAALVPAPAMPPAGPAPPGAAGSHVDPHGGDGAAQANPAPQAPPPGHAVVPAAAPAEGFGSPAPNPMTNFLQQPLSDITSPDPRAPMPQPHQQQPQPPQQYDTQQQHQQQHQPPAMHPGDQARPQNPPPQGGQPQGPQPPGLQLQPTASVAPSEAGGWQRDDTLGALVLRPSASMTRQPTIEREALPPAPSMSASPRTAVAVRTLPNVRMAHTPLGQVQLPAMPPVALPNAPEAPRGDAEDPGAWNAFNDLRKQLEDSHGRTLALHQEISRMQIAHEKEAAALQTSVKAQLESQSRELQDMTENYNSATAKLDQLSTLLARKAEDIMKLDQRLHNAELEKVAIEQKMAHVEDRVKLADQARQVAEVRTRELELSLEHATTLIQSLRRQLSVANDEKNNALTEQYNTFEANRQQLIEFYAGREQFMLGSYAESLNNVQLSMQQYLTEREAEVERKWEETFRTQLDHQQSLHQELVSRADRHVEEVTKLKAEQEAEKEKALAHMQREIHLADERAQERMKNLVEDVSRRELELGERETQQRVRVSQSEQDAKIALLSREAEMKAQYDRLLEDAKTEFEKDRERLSIAYREQIAALSAQHMANERELERLHREKEREMAQRYRVANWEDDDRRTAHGSTEATARSQSVLLAKMDKMQADQEARRLAARARFAGTTAKPPSHDGSTVNPTGDDGAAGDGS